jgi:23S rRNA (cytidine2498-2'-O)-methyltransferase
VSTLQGYLAFPGFLESLQAELKFAGIKPKKMQLHGELILVEGFRRKPVWARNIWGSVERIEFTSVADAVSKLKALGLRWDLYPHLHQRRAQLIAREVRIQKFPPLRFPQDPMPTKALGSFTLIAENEILASAHCAQTLPQGEMTFEEDRGSPPTRAYLKLWEVFTRLGRRPSPGDFCIDLGSSPGGWTWVIAKLGAEVTSVDRSELAPQVAALPGVRFRQGNAFTLDPKEFPKLDWLFSDVISEPGKILELVQRWLIIHPDASFICSVKFKGETDFRVMAALQRIKGSFMIHLNQNKHEVTWVRLKEGVGSSS